ncbi:MAG: four helix bundle protein [Anaerolineae bacterium]|nr:four helix bundle protein [Anaerolineae bacterium]
MQDFRKLQVWQRAHQFVLTVYSVSAAFPDDERYGLISQIRRAVMSIPANVAEGCGRETNAELRRFLYIAIGSATEVDYFLLLARDLAFIEAAQYQQLNQEVDEIKRMLAGFIRRLKT